MAKKRSRTREARQRRQQRRRQNRRLLILIAIVVLAVVAVAVIFVSNQPVEAFIPDDLSARYENLRRSYSPDGYPRLGDPDAPVTLEEYSSFACPGCEAFHSDSFDAVLERVGRGQVLFTYVPLQTGSIPNASGASRAALCAGQQGMFWEMHDVLFDWQTRYGNTAFSQNRLLAGVESLALNVNTFTGCFNSGGISATLDAAMNEDVASTPTLRVNGVTLEAGQTIPSAAAILEAIDAATPDNWRQSQEESAAEEVVTPPIEEEAVPTEVNGEAEGVIETDESEATPADVPTALPDSADSTDAEETVDAPSSGDPGGASAESAPPDADEPESANN